MLLCMGVFFAFPAHAENLHQKFGAGWDCGYITTGLPYKDLCFACERAGQEFDRVGESGTCVPKPGGDEDSTSPEPESPTYKSRATPEVDTDYTPPVRRTQAPPKKVWWNAIAAVVEKHDGGVRMSAGYAEATNPELAKKTAVQKCNETGIPGCKALGVWNIGCVYITTGTEKTSNSVRGGYMAHSTREGAASKCRSKFTSCKPPIGGCVNE